MAIDIIARGMIEESSGDISQLSEKVSNHTGNSDIHVTATDKSNWNGYANEIEQNKTDISQLFNITKGGADVGGESSYMLKNAVDYPLLGLTVYGKSVQDGVPTPENPVEIVSVGDNGNISVQSCGKNLLDMSLVKSTTKNGVTFTVNTDGSVLANGTASAYIAFDLITLTTKGDYIYSGTPKNGSTGTTGVVSVRITKTDDTVEYGADNGAGNKLVMDDSVKLAIIRIELHAGASPDNVIFYPMLRYKTEEDATFEPYNGATAKITSSLPLCGIPVESGGNYTDSNGQQWVCDELIYNAGGSGKIVKRTAKIDSYNGEVIATPFISTTGSMTTGATVIYQIAEPQEIQLTAAEMTALRELQTYNGTTNISNDGGADMDITYCTNKTLSEYVMPITTSLQKQINELKAAVLSLGGNI